MEKRMPLLCSVSRQRGAKCPDVGCGKSTLARVESRKSGVERTPVPSHVHKGLIAGCVCHGRWMPKAGGRELRRKRFGSGARKHEKVKLGRARRRAACADQDLRPH